ncbi:MAG: hypothetical protein G5663_00585 [Serratia symbiotica]|nr:hypothetical protein [Serratia symbiotica]
MQLICCWASIDGVLLFSANNVLVIDRTLSTLEPTALSGYMVACWLAVIDGGNNIENSACRLALSS